MTRRLQRLKMFRPAVGAVAMLAAAGSASAAEWPAADGPIVEARTAIVAVSALAPEWVDRAVHEAYEFAPDNLSATWALHYGFDSTGSRMGIRISDLDHYEGNVAAAISHFFDACPRWDSTLFGQQQPDWIASLIWCGADSGSGRGAVFYGFEGGFGETWTVEVYYYIETDRFDLADESTWPLTRAQMLAAGETLLDALAVAPTR
jgi:hypothetical protein